MSRQYDVITVGETTMDAFMTLDENNKKCRVTTDNELCFRHGEKINVEKYDFAMGGNATNVAVGISRLGLNVAPCTEIGDDEFSIKIRNWLAQEHIERLLMIQTPGQTNFSVVINFQTDRTIFVQDVTRKHEFHFDEVAARCVYLTSLGETWEDAYTTALAFAREQKALLAFNPGHLQIKKGGKVVREVLSQTDLLFVNKEEAELLLMHHYGEKDDDSDQYIQHLAEKLQKKGVKIVIITNGKDGSYVLDRSGKLYKKEMHPGEPVERTGAGDAYASGFLAATLHGLPIEKAMKWGSINAASVVSKVGAETGLLKKEEIEKLIDSN